MREKNVLLIENDRQFVAELQSRLAYKCNLLAAEDSTVVSTLLKKSTFDFILIHLPPADDDLKHKRLKKTLRKISKGKFSNIPKILIDVEGNEDRVPEYLRLNVTAAVKHSQSLEDIWEL